MIRLLHVIVALLLAGNVVLGQRLFTKQYTTAEGLAQNQVFAIAQDSGGFMWFGTAGGLSRFDGRNWTTYAKEDGLPSTVVRAIEVDSRNRLWLGTDEGICLFDARVQSFTVVRPGSGTHGSVGGGVVRDVKDDHRGMMWFATSSGLTTYDEKKNIWRNYTTADGLPSDVVLSLAPGRDGKMYAGTQQGLCIVSTRPDQSLDIEIVTTIHGLINNRVEALLVDIDGVVWIGTPVGVSRMESGRITNYTASHGLPHSSVRGFFHGTRKRLWIATEGGASRIDRKSMPPVFTNFSSLNGFPSSQVYTIMEDRENNYWFGSFGKGVTKLLSEEFVTYGTSHGLPGDAILSLASDETRRLIIGTTNGLAILDSSGKMKTYGIQEGLTHTEIWDIMVDSNGLTWLGTYNDLQLLIPVYYPLLQINSRPAQARKIEGLLRQSRRINDHYSINLHAYPDLIGHRIAEITRDSKGQVWFAASNSGLGRITISEEGAIAVKMFTVKDGLPNANPWCMQEDKSGRLWIGFIGAGLSFLDETGNRFLTINDSNGIPDNVSLALSSDEDGRMWVGTEQGVYGFPIDSVVGAVIGNPSARLDQFIQVYSKRNVLNDNSVNAVISGGTGKLWVGTNNGLHLLDTRSHQVLKMYSKKQGLADNEISTHNSLLMLDEFIWVGTGGGLTAIPKVLSGMLPIPPPVVYVTRFSIEDFTQHTMRAISLADSDPGGHLLESDENNLTFEFVAPSFKDENDVRYRYRLIGFDKEWSAPVAATEVRYTNLDDGTYRFEVIAANGLDQWSVRPTAVDFHIKTPFWKSWWFILFVTSFIGLGVYTLYQFRVSLVHQRTSELEEKVLKRTRELIVQKETVERILNELKETQTQLVHSEKMASLGQMVAGIAHEINNPITFIKANLSLLQRKVGDVQQVFFQFSELFEYYEKFKDFRDADHDAFRGRLEDLDRKIEAAKFERFLEDFPTVIKEMNEGVDRTHKIVDDLKNFSRLDEAHFKETSIHDCIESTLNILKNEYKTRIQIHRNYADLPRVYCNPGHINQVLMNLFVNAFQAIEGEGDVYIRTSAGTNNILVAIRDTGKGIPEEIKNKVYDPFFTTKPVGKGTGLGLAISYKILEAHKGTIFFDSTPGKGTEFKITLPIRRATDPLPDTSSEVSASR